VQRDFTHAQFGELPNHIQAFFSAQLALPRVPRMAAAEAALLVASECDFPNHVRRADAPRFWAQWKSQVCHEVQFLVPWSPVSERLALQAMCHQSSLNFLKRAV
jgi:hypothetical protein